ncbi:MAG: hypothetical protein KGH49_01275 [Candidatus Micrarchaeota archaeon]|nr:hypothetical protein [Candidatus Micrarchaeota archaeon]
MMGYRASALAVLLVLMLALALQEIVNAQSSSPIQITFTVSTSGLTITPNAISVTDNSGASISSVTVLWGDHTESYWTAADGPLSTFFGPHTYPQASAYTVTVIADDSADNTQTITRQVTTSSPSSASSNAVSSASANSPISLVFTLSTSGLTATPTTVSATDSAAALSSVTVSWGDGTQSQWTAASGPISSFFGPHTYSQYTTYTITVTATDSANNANTLVEQLPLSSAQSSNTVSPTTTQPPIVLTLNAVASGLVLVPTLVNVVDTSGASLTTALVTWGDGASTRWVAGDGPLPSFFGPHAYAAGGQYAVTISATDSANNANSLAEVFTMSSSQSTANAIAPTQNAQAIGVTITYLGNGLTVTPTVNIKDPNSGSGASLTEVDLSWGDGTSDAVWVTNGYAYSQTFAGSHTYQSGGFYTISVNAIDSTNAQGFGTKQVSISGGLSTNAPSTQPSGPSGIQASLTASASGLTVTPTITITDPNQNFGAALTSVDVAWGDNTPDSQWLANGYGFPATFPGPHTYSQGGSYTITLRAIDSALAIGSAAQKVIVSGASTTSQPTQASFTTSPVSIGTSLTVSPSSGLAVLGSMEVNDQNINSGASLTSVVWDWGDGTTSVWTASSGVAALLAFPGVHTYQSANSYKVVETVIDSAGEVGTASAQVTVPLSSQVSSSKSILASSTVSSSGLTITPSLNINDPNSAASIVSEEWSWGDGTADSVWTASSFSAPAPGAASGQQALAQSQPQAPPASFPGPHTYAKAGSYQVAVSLLDDQGGTASAQQQVLVGTQPQQQAPSTLPSVTIHAIASSYFPGGTGFIASTGPQLPYSPVSAVNSMNAQSALWLLTCPNPPQGLGSTKPVTGPQYFESSVAGSESVYGGNQCATHPTSTTTDFATLVQATPPYYGGYISGTYSTSGSTVTYTSQLTGSPITPQPTGQGLISINGLGFSPQVDSAVADFFSKSPSIFSQLSSGDLNVLWTWFSEVPHLVNPAIPISPPGALSFSPGSCPPKGAGECWGEADMATTISVPYEASTIISSGTQYSTFEQTTTCIYPTYTYTSKTKVQDFANSYIPFNEIFKDGGSNIFQTAILPYMNYQISIPSLFGQILQLSYDVFSPSIYPYPQNNLDPLPITIGSQFYINYNNNLQIGTQSALAQWTTSSKDTLTNPQASTAQYDAANPTSQAGYCNLPPHTIAESYGAPYPYPGAESYQDSLYCNYCQRNPGSADCPLGQNGNNAQSYFASCVGPTYINAIYYFEGGGSSISLASLNPTPSSPLTQSPSYCQPYSLLQPVKETIQNPISVISLPTDYTYVLSGNGGKTPSVYVFRTIPYGRYDVGAPSTLPAAPTQQIWDAEWQMYWERVIQAQSDNNYIVANVAVASPFAPINMTVDYSGDIFLTGYMDNGAGIMSPAIEEITNPTASGSQVIGPTVVPTTSCTGASPDMLMPEIAASPTGQYVFLANQSDGGYVYEYAVSKTQVSAIGSCTQSASQFPYYGDINLAFQAPSPVAGAPASAQVVSVNTLAWLENSGPYGQQQTWINGFLNSYSTPPTPGSDFDTAAYHHPLAIQDVNGYLYVMDNWAGGLDVVKEQSSTCALLIQCNYDGVFFSFLDMRIINSSGLNVPISPSFVNDLYQTGTCQLSTTPPQSPPLQQGACTTIASSQVTCVPSTATAPQNFCQPPIDAPCTLSVSGKPTGGNSYTCTAAGQQASQSTYTSQALPGQYASNIYPPYGWIISGNVTATQLQELPLTPYYGLQTTGNGASVFKTVNFCDSSACDYNPKSLANAGYQDYFSPIGPQITALNMSFVTVTLGSQQPRAVSTAAPISTKWAPIYDHVGFSVGFNDSLSLLFTKPTSNPQAQFGYSLTSNEPNAYNALILTSFSPQNYTNLFQGSPISACYTDDPNVASAIGCSTLGAIANMRPPLYNMPDPLAYVMSLGGSQQLTLGESINSGTPAQTQSTSSAITSCAQSISQSGTSSTSQECSSAAPSSSSSCAQWIAGGEQGTAPAGCTATSATTSAPQAQSLTVTINGQVIVPYSFSYTQDQTWSNFADGTCTVTVKTTTSGSGHTPGSSTSKTTVSTGQSRGSPSISPPTSQTGTFYTAASSPIFTNTLTVGIDGGSIYLQDILSNYYKQNLSDYGTTLSPQQIYNVQTNRNVGDAMVNITTNPLHNGNGNQYIINATHQTDYQIVTYSQGTAPGYELISSVPLATAQNGIAAAVNILSNTQPASTDFVNQNYVGTNSIFSLSPSGSTVATLFEYYIAEAFSSVENLLMSNTILTSSNQQIQYQALGYNRLLYVFRDAFNNTITAPIDADIAQPSTVSYTITPTVSPTNANQTTLAISGTLTYTQNGATYPIANNEIYVYYNHNLNYVNYNPSSGQQGVIGAQYCANSQLPPGQTTTSACAQANPLNAIASQVLEAQQATYAPAYNSMGECGPAPQALLTPLSYNCNINGLDNLPQTCPGSAYKNTPQYCQVYTSDGSGICTAQEGLIGVATTDSNGAFTLSPTVVCGIGTAQINATYYGYAGPEPTTVLQTPLTVASQPATTCANSQCINTPVTNYYYSPNHSVQSAPIGIFELAYGDINRIVLLLAIGTVVVAVIYSMRRQKRLR